MATKPTPPRRPTRAAPAVEPEEVPEDVEGPDPANATMISMPPEPGEDEGPPPEGATMVMNVNAVKPPGAAATAKLVVTKGPKTGEEFTLGPGDTSVGRQSDNTIQIADISVSRKHVVLRKQGIGYLLIDQGSGNGTLLNGERVQGEAELNDGDVFQMGDTEVQYKVLAPPRAAPRPSQAAVPRASAAPGGPPRPSSRANMRAVPPRPSARPPGKRRLDDEDSPDSTGQIPMPRRGDDGGKKKKLLVAVVALLVLAIGGYAKVTSDRKAAVLRAQQEAEEAAYDKVVEAVGAAFEQGKAAIRKQDYKGSITFFEDALAAGKQLPEEDKTIKEVKAKLEFARGEVDSQTKLEKARELIGKGEFAAASDLLKKIPDGSVFVEQVPAVKSEMKSKIPDRLTTVRGLIASKDYDGARAAVADIEAADPGNPEAAELTKQIDKESAAPEKGSGKARKADDVKEDPTEKALAAFKGGRVDDAIGLAKACSEPKCQLIADQLEQFRDAFNDLDNNVDKASTLLKKLGGSPHYQQIIGQKAGVAYAKEGVKAMGADNLPKAFESFRKCLAVDPDNAVARKNMAAIRQKANDLFQQAYVDKSSEPDKARREFEQIISMTAPEDELNQKAKKHLKSLSGGD